MLNEAECRLPGFSGGHKIRWPDGQEWWVPAPMIRLAPMFDGAGRVESLRAMTDLGPELDELVQAVEQAEDARAETIAVMTLGLWMLRRNYDIPDHEAPDLLAWTVDGDNDHLIEILRVATGTAPKQ